MANLEGGNFNKFTVLKNEDIEKYSTCEQKDELFKIIYDIELGRFLDNKNPSNTYLIINTDESYADEVIAILKRNGHWG